MYALQHYSAVQCRAVPCSSVQCSAVHCIPTVRPWCVRCVPSVLPLCSRCVPVVPDAFPMCSCCIPTVFPLCPRCVEEKRESEKRLPFLVNVGSIREKGRKRESDKQRKAKRPERTRAGKKQEKVPPNHNQKHIKFVSIFH